MSAPDPHAFFEERILGGEPSPEDYRRLVELLWQAYSESVFLHAHAKLSNTEDARDVCQDAFVRVLQWLQTHRGEMPQKVNFPAWLRRITRNLIIDRFRRPALVAPWPEPRQGTDPDAVPHTEFPDQRAQQPADQAALQEELDALRKCIEDLKSTRRKMITLRDLDGVSYADIAHQLGVPTGTVCGTLHRARKQLRECVELRVAAPNGLA